MDKKFTVPNIVTTIGIIAIVFYIFAFINNKTSLLFTALAVIALSDLFDGFLARKLDQATEIGEFLDRARDRFFQIAVIGNLILIGRWYSVFGVFLIIVLETSITTAPFLFPFFLKKTPSHFILKIKQGSYIVSIFYLYRAAIAL